MKILSSTDKKKILEKLKQRFGIEKLPYLLLQFGKEKIRGYSGNLSREELSVLDKNVRVENIGLYLAKIHDSEIKLSLDSLHMLKKQISKNIVNLTKHQAESWFKGQDIVLDKEIQKGFVILKYGEDFIGCGKVVGDGTIIKNYMPKERRIKN